jgi:hypothetical protein
MGYSIWVADDPQLPAVEAGVDLSADERLDFPHFSTSLFGMGLLGVEMEAQGMLESMPRWKFEFNDGEHVTVEEI